MKWPLMLASTHRAAVKALVDGRGCLIEHSKTLMAERLQWRECAERRLEHIGTLEERLVELRNLRHQNEVLAQNAIISREEYDTAIKETEAFAARVRFAEASSQDFIRSINEARSERDQLAADLEKVAETLRSTNRKLRAARRKKATR